ncbi:MAG: preprotein translocase subunit YajC [bacterium]
MILVFLAQAGSGTAGLMGFLPFLVMLLILYLLILRPQMKKQKAHTSMLRDLDKGDEVVTVGGIHGKIVDINNSEQTMEIVVAKGITVTVERSAVARKKTHALSDGKK